MILPILLMYGKLESINEASRGAIDSAPRRLASEIMEILCLFSISCEIPVLIVSSTPVNKSVEMRSLITNAPSLLDLYSEDYSTISLN